MEVSGGLSSEVYAFLERDITHYLLAKVVPNGKKLVFRWGKKKTIEFS